MATSVIKLMTKFRQQLFYTTEKKQDQFVYHLDNQCSDEIHKK